MGLPSLDECPKHDAKYIIGDFNANIGREAIFDVLLVCTKNPLTIGTCIQKVSMNLMRWYHCQPNLPCGVTPTCIHPESNGRKVLSDIKSQTSFLVLAKINARISIAKGEKPHNNIGFHIEALKPTETSAAFAARVSQQIEHEQTNKPSGRMLTTIFLGLECTGITHKKNAENLKWLVMKETKMLEVT